MATKQHRKNMKKVRKSYLGFLEGEVKLLEAEVYGGDVDGAKAELRERYEILKTDYENARETEND